MDQQRRVEVPIREKLGNMTQVLPDLVTAHLILRIVRFDLDSAALWC